MAVVTRVTRLNNNSIFPPPLSSSSRKVKKELTFQSASTPSLIDMAVIEYDRKHCLYKIENFLSKMECLKFIKWSEEMGSFERCDLEATICTAERRQERSSYFDADGLISTSIFNRIQTLLPTSIDGLTPFGCSKNIRFYKYNEGDLFSRHIDESNVDSDTHAVSKLTLLIYLNGGNAIEEGDEGGGDDGPLSAHLSFLKGGHTIFYSTHTNRAPFLIVEPEQGAALLHGHGKRCLTHEGGLVEAGVKYVLRTDVMYR